MHLLAGAVDYSHMSPVAVLTADVVKSTRYGPSERRELHDLLLETFSAAAEKFPAAWATSLTFSITAGDEFQGVIADVSAAFRILVYVRAELAMSALSSIPELRAGIGLGSVTVPGGTSSWEQDGPAFVRSRRALESLKKSRREWRRTAIVTGDRHRDGALAAVLGLCDHIQQRWTQPQWQAIHHTIEGAKTKEVASRLGIARQNVTKRLQAAGWPAVDAAMTHVACSLTQVEYDERDSRSEPRIGGQR